MEGGCLICGDCDDLVAVCCDCVNGLRDRIPSRLPGKPTEPGWYLYRGVKCGGFVAPRWGVATVVDVGGGRVGVVMVRGQSPGAFPDGGDWFGPIRGLDG